MEDPHTHVHTHEHPQKHSTQASTSTSPPAVPKKEAAILITHEELKRHCLDPHGCLHFCCHRHQPSYHSWRFEATSSCRWYSDRPEDSAPLSKKIAIRQDASACQPIPTNSAGEACTIVHPTSRISNPSDLGSRISASYRTRYRIHLGYQISDLFGGFTIMLKDALVTSLEQVICRK